MLFTASGAASHVDIPREAFTDLMGRYFDMYRASLNKQS
jgi:hypothetical protein